MEDHITGLGLDMGKEEGANPLNQIVVRAHRKGAKEFGEHMKARDNWDKAASRVERNSEIK